MKKYIVIILFFATCVSGFSTEQIADILIIEEDTFYLDAFPLEDLEFEKRPFKYGEYDFPHTGCWRGYFATWQINDNKLILVQIQKADSTKEGIDIKEYFELNNYSPKYYKDKVYADWYNKSFTLTSHPYRYNYEEIYLQEIHQLSKIKTPILLSFENGIIKTNKLNSINSFSIGDTLNYKFNHFPPGLIDKDFALIEGVILEKKGMKVTLEITSFGVENEKDRKSINNYVKSDKNNQISINPVYWNKNNNGL